MDSLSFDQLARLFGSGASRRRMLRAAGASSLGVFGTGALLGRDEVMADKGGKGKKRRCKKFNATCNKNQKKCCQGLKCEEGSCCKKLGTKCEDGSECCGEGICDNVTPGGQDVCCHLNDEPCHKDNDCCDTRVCNPTTDLCEDVI